ncbi:cilia- and flagella-associated protein 221 [Hyperolius riggenbachi]|uniref:cilia- and flagella-associated protein 221 n=1 Tax=Hyperolius riggenbachi TaxID=752182 RepID=UPI0035A36A02
MDVAPPAVFSFPKDHQILMRSSPTLPGMGQRMRRPPFIQDTGQKRRPPPTVPDTEQSMTRPASLTLDSMVEEVPGLPVPNHLLESKVYSKLGRNGSVETEPAAVHYAGYEIGKSHRQLLKLVNLSPDVTTVHIIPPQSQYFSISYKKANRLVPGLALTVQVNFIPDEWRYYYDCIRVHCKDDETLLVPLHAYPVTDLQDFPSHVDLQVPSLGQSAHYTLPLRCSCPVDFEFRIVYIQHHKDFDVSPTLGIIPGNGAIDVIVTFTPSNYETAQITLELMLSEFNAKSHSCVFTGKCAPNLGAAKESLEQTWTSPKVSTRSPEKVLLSISRKKRHLQTMQQNASRVIEFQNLRFPLNLSSPHSVATVLNQQPGRVRLKDMREGLTFPTKKNRQEKETLFQQLVQQNVAEEEANQLRWQVHLGSDPISPNQRQRILDERQSPVEPNQVRSGHAEHQKEYGRWTTHAMAQRVMRRAGQYPTLQPQFDLYRNNLWANRNRALRRFQQAARKVLIRCRVSHRLGHIKKLVELVCGKPEEEVTFESVDEDVAHILPVSSDHILFHDFSPYPAEPDGPSSTDLRSSTPEPAAVHLKVVLPFYDLKVPQHYRLMGYHRVNIQGVSSTYHTRRPAQPLRRGAEEELLPAVPSQSDAPALTVSYPGQSEEEESLVTTALTLTPPEELLRPPSLHPMHVFNPAPGLLAFKGPLSYCETDLESHLCPLPKYQPLRETTGSPQRKYLTREDMLRGVMTWKKFPPVAFSVSLPSGSSGRPRWCDPFSADLLPTEAPPILSDLLPEDRDSIELKVGGTVDVEGGASLTPQMMKAEFAVMEDGQRDIDSGQQSSDDRTSLMDKIQSQLNHMTQLSHNKRLILKCDTASSAHL